MTTHKSINDMTLPEWAEHSAEFAAKVFNETGSVTAMWIMESENGDIIPIVAPLTDKDKVAQAVKQIFKERQAKRFIFMTEGWMLEAKMDGTRDKDIERHINSGRAVSEHQDRREVIMVSGEDRERSIMGMMYILRPKHGKPTVSAFKLLPDMSRSEGRFTGMLP